jgi:hypothetical protein
MKEVKYAYFRKARKYHPDKLKHDADTNTITFIDIQEAYNCVIKCITMQDVDSTNNTKITMPDYIHSLLNMYKQDDRIYSMIQTFVTNMKDNLQKESYTLLHRLISDYYKRKETTEDTYCVTLQPTIDNLFDHDIYSLMYHDDIYYIPLWHEQVEFVNETGKVVVNIQPVLPKDVWKDDNNVLYIYHTLSTCELLGKDTYDIVVGKRRFTINVLDLKIQPFQCISFIQSGIASISTTSMFSIDTLNNVYIYLVLI